MVRVGVEKNHWICLLGETPSSWIGKGQGYRSGDLEWSPPTSVSTIMHLKPNAVETTAHLWSVPELGRLPAGTAPYPLPLSTPGVPACGSVQV